MTAATKDEKLDADEVYCIASGLVCCSVCVPSGMSREVIEQHVNAKNPTGISSRWKISEDSHFAGGQTNPCDCESDPGRMHYLLNC